MSSVGRTMVSKQLIIVDVWRESTTVLDTTMFLRDIGYRISMRNPGKAEAQDNQHHFDTSKHTTQYAVLGNTIGWGKDSICDIMAGGLSCSRAPIYYSLRGSKPQVTNAPKSSITNY